MYYNINILIAFIKSIIIKTKIIKGFNENYITINKK